MTRCVHLGPRQRSVYVRDNCPARRRIRIHVCGCEIHGECTVFLQLAPLANCKRCRDFVTLDHDESEIPEIS